MLRHIGLWCFAAMASNMWKIRPHISVCRRSTVHSIPRFMTMIIINLPCNMPMAISGKSMRKKPKLSTKSKKEFSLFLKRKIPLMFLSATRKQIQAEEGHRTAFWQMICTINLRKKDSRSFFHESL